MKQHSKIEQKKLLIEIMDDDSKLGLYSVKHVSIRLFLYIAIALVPVGCGRVNKYIPEPVVVRNDRLQRQVDSLELKIKIDSIKASYEKHNN